MSKMKIGIIAAALLTSVLAFGETCTKDGLIWTYTASSGNATLSEVAREDGNPVTGLLAIPSTVTSDKTSASATVTVIGEKSFRGLAITGVSIPDTVSRIGAGAFRDCTALETLVIPDSVTEIGASQSSTYGGAFNGCTALKSVTLGNGLVTIGQGSSNMNYNGEDSWAYSGAFGNCSSLETVTFGSNLETIGNHAFSGCNKLKSLTLPDSVQTIGTNAFYRNLALESVSLGTDLLSIGDAAFANCPELQTVEFRECNTPLLTIGGLAFAHAEKLTTLTLSESLKKISAGAFRGCIALETLVIPDSVTEIGASQSSTYGGAFNGCTALKSVTLGNGLVTIGQGSSNMNYNGEDSWAYSGAFGNCSSLETVTFGSNLETIGNHAFSECRHIKSLMLPDSVQTIGVNCFYNGIRLTSVSLGADLELIGECAFMGCVSLSSITFSPATTPLLRIKSKAFKDCWCLATLTLSNAMPTIETGAFENCTALRRATIPSLLSTIQDDVFASMSDLKEVIFLGMPPENLENAGLAADVSIRYPSEYADDWESVITECGFTNAQVYEPTELGDLVGDSRYGLSTEPGDRSIASVTISTDTALDAFVLENGKVYDCVVRIVNTADEEVSVTLPTGFTYETFKGTSPLAIPANSRNILTITRTSDSTFLVAREELTVLQ